MSKLVNVPKINQNQLLSSYDFSIKERQNILVLGPSGAGKTDMGFQACKQNDLNCIYWNLSVMERPDIQGLPAVAPDRRTAAFAPIEHMPFVGMDKIRNERKLEKIISIINEDDPELGYFLHESKKQLKKLKNEIAIDTIRECAELFDTTQLQNSNIDPSIIGNENSKNVLLLDEVDKTPPENLQPLLELLLYHSINARPLDIRSVMMTANMPDEHTYSEPLSHAITNRAMVFELEPNPAIWLHWGRQNNLHPMVLGFLSRDENAMEFFNNRPGNNDMYSYNYTSPRSWTQASLIMTKFDKYEKEGKLTDLRDHFLSSVIGTNATQRLKIWFQYYRKYEKLIDEIFSGKNSAPPKEDNGENSFHATIVVAIALANKLTQFAKNTDDTDGVQKKVTHVFGWIANNCPQDVRVCAFRSSFDKPTFLKHKLDSFETTRQMWMDLLEMYQATTSGQKI